MKKEIILLSLVLLTLSACEKTVKPIEAVADTNAVETKIETIVETTLDSVDRNNGEVENISDAEEETVEQEDNDFMAVLDALKEVHPGTAGSSLKVMYAGYKFLNSCRTKLPFDKIAEAWVEKQNKDDYANINESFTFVYDSLDNFKGDKVKELLSDAGVELPDGVSFEGIIDEAKRVLNVVIEKTKS